jgi:hypothetical protein
LRLRRSVEAGAMRRLGAGHRPRAFAGRGALGAVVLLLVLAGCSGVQTLTYPAPPHTTVAPVPSPPTLPANLPGVAELAVPGATSTAPPAIGPGGATLDGTVLGPNGPVAGATVEVDRLVGSQAAVTETTTAADGSWRVGSVLGGRFRVRAWQAPSLAEVTPQILFVGATQDETVTLQLTTFTGPDVTSSFAPDDPIVGEIDNLVVQVTNPTVGSDGVVRNLPVVGVSVTLTNGPQWVVYNGNPQPTASDGQVLFQVSCQAVGSPSMSTTVGNGAPETLQLPTCGAAPTTTTTSTTTPCSSTTLGTPEPSSTTSSTVSFGLC